MIDLDKPKAANTTAQEVCQGSRCYLCKDIFQSLAFRILQLPSREEEGEEEKWNDVALAPPGVSFLLHLSEVFAVLSFFFCLRKASDVEVKKESSYV